MSALAPMEQLRWQGGAQAMAASAYLLGNIASHLGPEVPGSEAWRRFSASWSDLAQDGYMADGGTYRRRRYSEFLVEPDRDHLALLPHVPYRQPKDVNYLNGDIDRHYPPIAADTVHNEAFRSVVLGCAKLLNELHPGSAWRAQIFQNRILARPASAGLPTPEGVHRDGVDYVLSLLSERRAVSGGESRIYQADGVTPLGAMLLEKSGDFALLDDQQTKHSVTPIECARADVPGHRDMLIVMYIRQ